MRVKTRFMFVSALLRRGEGGEGRDQEFHYPKAGAEPGGQNRMTLVLRNDILTAADLASRFRDAERRPPSFTPP